MKLEINSTSYFYNTVCIFNSNLLNSDAAICICLQQNTLSSMGHRTHNLSGNNIVRMRINRTWLP